jgi:hypothetical protein
MVFIRNYGDFIGLRGIQMEPHQCRFPLDGRASLPHPYEWSSQRNFSFSLFIRCFYSSTEASHSFHKSATIRTFSTTCSGCVQHGRSPCHSLAKFWTRVYCRSFLRWSRALFWSSRNLERSPTNRSIQAPLNNRG